MSTLTQSHIAHSSRTWLITGASQGFGNALAREALSRGDTVMAVVRNPSSLDDLAELYPDKLHVEVIDLTESRAAEHIASQTLRSVGIPDVLVNNAGRGVVGSAEDVEETTLREVMELNFFAAAALTRAFLPSMRERGSGDILQFSSQGGRVSFSGAGTYSASKFALEGWSEALAMEVAPFGIRVCLIEPSRFRTGFNSEQSLTLAPVSDAYSGLMSRLHKDVLAINGKQEGDPARAAAIIADLVSTETLPQRLPLGREAVRRLCSGYRTGLVSVQEWQDLARSADFPDAPESVRPV